MSYEKVAQSALEYYPCRYGTSKTLFRGPKKETQTPFVAVLGGSEAYGRYVEQPFSELLQAQIGKPCVNFGQMNAGVDVFAGDSSIMEMASEAEVTIVQVLPAHNMSNRFYHVHPRRNDRFVKPSSLMQTLFQDVDFSEFHFTRHMLVSLKATSPDKFRMIEQELQAAWTARMRLLLTRIPGRKILLWLPDDTPTANGAELGPAPLFVNARMVESLRPLVEKVVHYEPAKIRVAAGIEEMKVPEMEAAVARELLPPACHRDIANALAAAIG
jgi:hypothetical protein